MLGFFEFLKWYFHTSLEMPSPQTIKDYFESRKDEECKERVGDFETNPVHKGTNYTFLLKNTVERQNNLRATQYLKEAQEIINKGLVLENEKKQGLRDGINHIVRKAHELLFYESNAKIDGNIRCPHSSARARAKASAFRLNRAVSGISFITNIPSDGQ